jgi:hypothetical protein
MWWDRIEADAEKRALAIALIEHVPQSGWRERTLCAASTAALCNEQGWRRTFPNGARDAIWFISEVSDASMKLAFEASPAGCMSTVVAERLEQNGHLKLFVRKVMLYDLLHPIQAVRRMQRTAHAMLGCMPRMDRAPSRFEVAALNAAYTVIVFVWLFDTTRGQSLTSRTTASVMRLIGQR